MVGEHKLEKERYPRRYRGLSGRAVPAKEAPKGIGLARFAPAKGWDTSKGRKWVVVAFWGVETTVTFHRDEDEANEAYEAATLQGADVFYAKTARMMLQSDPPVV